MTKQCVEDHLSIGVKELLVIGGLVPLQVVTGCLIWNADRKNETRVEYVSTMEVLIKSRIVFKGLRHNRRDNGRQEINLVATYPVLGGIEFLFLAPCCGGRKRKLYFKKDRSGFGCRTCLNLTYAVIY